MKILRLSALLLFVSAICLRVAGQGTAFTYQGMLNNGGAPANGSYDIQFTLYATNVTGSPLAGPVTNSATSVSHGLFTAIVDFGPGVFNGRPLWLDVSVSPAGSNTFTELTPRQPITSTPYAVMAGGASNLLGTLPAAALPSVVLTNGASNVNISGTFSGNGANITGVNLENVNSDGAISLTTNGGNFTPVATLPVGNGPESVTAADVNGDGKVDLICANEGNNTLTVLTNNGSGGFALASTLNVGVNPISVIAADVNGDGKVDLICANSGDNTLTILTNNGSGGFTIASSPVVGSAPNSVTAADVNGDGKIDLICANEGDNTLTILTNNGSGGFAIASSPGVGIEPYSVTAADVNGDGKVDLICANFGESTLTVLTNDGSGGFAIASSPIVGTEPDSVTAADVNGDGKVDLICADFLNNALSVLTNDGSGGFASAPSLTVGSGPISVTAADVNGDGKVDLICANESNNTLTVLTNNGSGGFTIASSPGVGTLPISVTAADVNGDGKVDLICANLEDNTLTILTVFAATFTGNGSGLSGLSLAALPAGVVINGETGVNLNGTFSGDGSGLTLPAGVVFNNDGGLNLSGTFSGTFTGNGSGLTLPSGVVFNDQVGVSLIGTFAGNGSGLSQLNASSLASGTLPAASFAATTVTNFTQITGPLPKSFGFTSHGGRLVITAVGSGWTTGSGVIIGMSVSLDGTTILTNQIYANSGNFHLPFEARTVVLNNIAANTHTLTFTALSSTTTDSQDFFSATVQELPY